MNHAPGPAAQQNRSFRQRTELNPAAGELRDIQLAPPSVVARTELCGLDGISLPTAMQSFTEPQPIEVTI